MIKFIERNLEVEYPKVNRIERIVLWVCLFLIPFPLFALGAVTVPFEILRVASADTPSKESLNWGICGTYFSQKFRPTLGQDFLENRTTISIGMGYMLTDEFGAGISSELVKSVNDTGSIWVGKIGFEAKAYFVETSSLRAGLILTTSIPVYNTNNGAELTALDPLLVLTLDPADRPSLPPYRIHFNLGYSLTADGDRLNDLLLFGVGVELTAKKFTPFMEFTTEQAINDNSVSLRENPIRLSPGLKWRVSSSLNFTFGLDLSISKPATPGLKLVEDWKVILGASKF